MFKNIVSRIMILLIKFYQHTISHYLMPACRFTPSCSEYGVQAIRKHGPLKGGYFALKRLLSCHPWGRHGYDPVP